MKKSEIHYPSNEFLRAMYWTVVDSAIEDFKRDPSYGIAIAKAASNIRKTKEKD